MKVQSVKRGEPLPEPSAAPQEDCFPTFSEAISFATKGTVRLPPTAKAADFKEEDLLAAVNSPNLDRMIGIAYNQKNYNGQTWIFMAVEQCGAIYYPSLTGGWDNAISSAMTFPSSGCGHAWHYESPNFTGQAIDCTACSDMGEMDKKTSSIFWTQ